MGEAHVRACDDVHSQSGRGDAKALQAREDRVHASTCVRTHEDDGAPAHRCQPFPSSFANLVALLF